MQRSSQDDKDNVGKLLESSLNQPHPSDEWKIPEYDYFKYVDIFEDAKPIP